MTKLFEEAVDAVRQLTAVAQDEIARVVLQLVRDEDLPPAPLSAEEEASFDESLAQAERGEFVSDETIDAFWTKHGL